MSPRASRFLLFFSHALLAKHQNPKFSRKNEDSHRNRDVSKSRQNKNIERERPHNLSRSLSLSLIIARINSFARRERRGRNLSLLFSLYYSLSIAKVFSLVREREREFKKNLCVTPLCAFPEEEEDNDQIVA